MTTSSPDLLAARTENVYLKELLSKVEMGLTILMGQTTDTLLRADLLQLVLKIREGLE